MKMFDDLFKSQAQRDREAAEIKAQQEREAAEAKLKADQEKRRARTKAKMKAEDAIASGNATVQKLERDNKASWEKARDYLKSGNKAAARMELSKYQVYGRMIEQYQKKTWIMQLYLTRLENAQTDEAYAESLGNIAAMVETDPSKILASLENAQGVLDDQTEIDRQWATLFTSETNRDIYKESELTPNLDGLMDKLADEAANDVGGTKNAKGSETEIAAGLERLQAMLDENEKK